MLGGEKMQEVGDGGEGRGGARSVVCVCVVCVCVCVYLKGSESVNAMRACSWCASGTVL